MNLLLLLSALLSALTGAGVGVRAPQVAVVASLPAESRVAVPARSVRRTGLPPVVLPSLPRVAAFTPGAALRLLPAIPAYLSRRRE